MEIKEGAQKFWNFLKEDSWPSFFVGLIIALIVIKFILFPVLTLLTGTALPLVIVESCSMYHSGDWNVILSSNIYLDNNIYIENVSNFTLVGGFTKGDIIFVLGPKNLKVGDVIIFNSGRPTPIIHRVVSIEKDLQGNIVYSTKGDNFMTNPRQLPEEEIINEKNVVGKAVFKVPFIGWIKLIFFDWMKPENQRGFC